MNYVWLSILFIVASIFIGLLIAVNVWHQRCMADLSEEARAQAEAQSCEELRLW